jgi:hypothetical protein
MDIEIAEPIGQQKREREESSRRSVDGTIVGMIDLKPLRAASIVLFAACCVAGCSEQQMPLAGSSAQYLTVEGKRIQVRVSPFGGPGEYRLIAARDAIGWNLDDENERRRAEYAANYYMKQTCVQRGYQVLEAGMLDTINYFARFKCNG